MLYLRYCGTRYKWQALFWRNGPGLRPVPTAAPSNGRHHRKGANRDGTRTPCIMENVNITEMAARYPQMCITVQAADLAAFASALIAEAMDRQRTAAEQQARAAAEDRLLKTNEASQLLGVSIHTLHRWRKRGYLDAVTLGGQLRFRQSDCRRILETGKPEA